MSLSRIAVEQREKEAKSLNAFLAFSLIGSLALHIGVLSLGIGKFLSKAPELEDEPIEIAIVELPTPQELAVKPKTQADGGSIGGGNGAILSSGGGGGFGVAGRSGGSPKNEPLKTAPSKPSIVASTVVTPPAKPKLVQRSSISTTRPQNQNIKLDRPSEITQAKPVIAPNRTPSKIVTQAKPTATSAPIPVAKVETTPVDTSKERSTQIQQLNNQRLNNLLENAKSTRQQAATTNAGTITAQQSKIAANLRNQAGSGVATGNSISNELRSRGSGNGTGTGNGTGNNTGSGTSTGSGTGTGTGSGTRTGNGTGSGTGTGNGRGSGTGTQKGNGNSQGGSTIATGARNTERRTSPGESDRNSPNPSSSGRLACRTCSKPKYPENARKRKLEGKAEISVDVDNKGNVTNVRLARTSGHSELDKAAVEQARNWKFNAPNGAAQGVTAKVDFAIEGSKRSRQNRERRRQRTARKQSVANRQNTQTTPVATTPGRQNTNTALKRSLRRQATTPRRRRVDTLPPRQAFDQPRRRQQSGGQTRLRESLRRLPTSSTNQTRIRRSRSQTTSPNQTKLRQSLRLHQQKSQSTPPNAP